MKKLIDPISIILRLSLGATFLINGAAQMSGKSANHLANFLVNVTGGNFEIAYYTGLFEFILGLLLVFGVFTGLITALIIVWGVALVVTNPLFYVNPLAALTQMNQILAQIGVSMAVFAMGSPTLSFDKFFFPFKNTLNAKRTRNIETTLAYSLGLSFALSFASIFLFISEKNYVVFSQWKVLSDSIPILTMPIIGAFAAISAVLLFLGYGRRQIGLGAAIMFLLTLLTYQENIESLALLGAALSLAIMPKRPIQALRMIPKRKLKDL